MAEIVLQGVTKSFGKTEVIHKTDVTINDGEFVVMVGPSGCGKSTLLRMIAGLETTTEGEIRIAGKRVNEVEPKDRNIAMVFQNYALYPHMSVYDNMAYGLKIRKLAKDDIERRVQRAAKILELGPYLQRKP
ncbi:MAG: ATP-binding cassette domain-containing protein, partial [Burkholderiales bacterium]|nr:ATP-binding cassette domain-containing protein [Burkholderiales bacterium]